MADYEEEEDKQDNKNSKTTGEGDVPVAVVGGGLVGSLQALFLARKGYKVILFESREDIRGSDSWVGRSINLALSFRGQEALKAVGCEEEVLASAIPMHSRMIHSLDGKMSPQAYSTEGKAIYSIDRLKLNQLLLDAAEAQPSVTLCFEHKLLRADLPKQTLTFGTPQGEKELNVDFTFGCDGAYSTVRRQMMRWDRLDYSQEYIPHGYKELHMPPAPDGDYAMPRNFLHIWPRQEFMMIALPNPDKSFTLTLFMPFKVFESIETEEELLSFFMKHFPDSIEKIGSERLVEDYFKNPTGSLVSVKCYPYYLNSRTVLMGDAAHAVVPFYGQGMNASMEDCLVFDECLQSTVGGGDLDLAAKAYSDARWKDGHAIADLSMYNYIEMRSHVTSRLFLFRKYIDNLLFFLFPRSFVPLYTMVAFTRIPYHAVVQRDKRQKVLVSRALLVTGLTLAGFVGYLGFCLILDNVSSWTKLKIVVRWTL